MRISFHYRQPSPSHPKPSCSNTFSTPLKPSNLYGSRQTAISASEYPDSQSFRMHQLLPSSSPLANKSHSAGRKGVGISPGGWRTKVTFTYLLDLGSDNIQCEIEELKIVLGDLAQQQSQLEEERALNRQQYQHLIHQLGQQCKQMREKSNQIQSAILQLSIAVDEAEE